MSIFKSLDEAVASLHKSVSEFPVGAASIDDFKPIEERIRNMRQSLKRANARLLMLKAQKDYDDNSEIPEIEDEEIIENLNEGSSSTLVTDMSCKLCLHTSTIQAVLAGTEGDTEMQKKIYTSMRKLFTLNDSILNIQQAIDNALQKQYDLKKQCQNSLLEYKVFLNEQDVERRKILEESNPEMARNKQKTKQTLDKINIMKKFITSFIGSSGHRLKDNKSLLEILERNKELIKIETIVEMCQGGTEAEL